jgi:hypothetical protein
MMEFLVMDDEERLDKEFSQILKGERSGGEVIDPYLSTLKQLEVLRAVPERDPQMQIKGREAFLQQVKSMSLPVSRTSSRRLKGWKTIFKKERLSMTTVMGIVLALVLAFGGVGTTAYAAQDSLPSEPLYPVKQFTEQVRLALTTDPEAETNLLLDLAEERLNEIETLAERGSAAPIETSQKLEEHLQLALSNCTQLGDPELKGALERLQNMSQIQLQTLQDLKVSIPQSSPVAQEGYDIAIDAMNNAHNEATYGLTDPETFRLRQGMSSSEDGPIQSENDPAEQGNKNLQPPGDGAAVQGQGAIPSDGECDDTGEGGGVNGNGNGDNGGVRGNGSVNGTPCDGDGDNGGVRGNGSVNGTPCETNCPPQDSENGSQGSQGRAGRN